MKKKICLFMALLMLSAGMSGCSSESGNSEYISESSVESLQEESVPGEESSVLSDDKFSEVSAGKAEISEISEISEIAEDSVTSEPSKKESSAKSEDSKTSSTVSKAEREPSKSVSEISVSETTSVAPSESSKENSKESSKETSKATSRETSTEVSKTTSKAESSSTASKEPLKEPEPSREPSKVQEVSMTEPESPTVKQNDNDIGGIELYNELFNTANRVTVNISLDKSEIDKLQADYQKYTARDDNKKSDIYRMATVTFKVGSKSYTLEEVGIRLKGNQSMEPFYDKSGKPNMCSFKLSFDEAFDDKDDYGTSAKVWKDEEARKARKKRKFATLNEMDIKWNISYDNSNIREIYATKLFEAANVLVQKINLSQMIVNGNNYGLVKIYEPIDKTFLEKRLPESAIGGDLYKCMWSECDSNGNRTGWWKGATYKLNNSYGIQDNPNGKKYNFNLKTNKKTSKHESLKNFLNVINKSNISKSDLEKVLDVDYYASFMAAEYFAGDPDDIRNNYNNHYIYFRKDNGKAIFIVYDNDRTLGITYGLNKNCAERNPYSSYAATQGEQENPLIKNTISHNPLSSLAYIRDKYAEKLSVLSKTPMLTSDADFNKMYNTAKNNYESIITPYTRFANQEQNFKFSLDGNKNGGDKSNMSFEQFRSAIMTTYAKSTP